MMRDRRLSPEVEEARKATQQVIDKVTPHVLSLAVTVEALERLVETERQETRDDT